jgi:hypothetical protein
MLPEAARRRKGRRSGRSPPSGGTPRKCSEHSLGIAREPRPSDAVLPGAEVSGDQPRESDADTLCWTGPDSSRTLLGVGVQQLTASAHGSPRAQQLAQELRKTGP